MYLIPARALEKSLAWKKQRAAENEKISQAGFPCISYANQLQSENQ